MTTTTVAQLPRLSLKRAAWLQVLPGIGNLAVFAPLAWLLHRAGLPNLLALAGAVLIGEAPISWWLIVREVRRERGAFEWSAAFPWMARIPLWQYVLIGLPLILFGVAVIGGLTPPTGQAIREGLGLGVPEWFLLEPDPSLFASASRATLITLLLTSLLAFAGLGGVTQELFARGFLLPRIAHAGAGAPAFNAFWFAVLHLATPWNWPGFFLLALPWAYLTWWRRSAKLGLFGHVGMLLLQSLFLSLLVFGGVDPSQMAPSR